MNNPEELLKFIIVDETAAPSVSLVAPSNKYAATTEASADTPILFTLKPVIFTSALSPLVRVNLANGYNAWPSTIVPEAGLFDANCTVNPAPVGTTTGGCPGITTVPPDNVAFNACLVNGPTCPAGVHPCSA